MTIDQASSAFDSYVSRITNHIIDASSKHAELPVEKFFTLKKSLNAAEEFHILSLPSRRGSVFVVRQNTFAQSIYEELVKSQKSSEALFFAYTEFEVMHGF